MSVKEEIRYGLQELISFNFDREHCDAVQLARQVSERADVSIEKAEIAFSGAKGVLQELVSASEASSVAYDACVLLVAQAFQNQKPLPSPLADFALGVVRGERSRPKGRGRPRRNINIDLGIVWAVERAMELDPELKHYDNWESGANNACEIVSELLLELGVALGYESVKQIWLDRPPDPQKLATGKKIP